MSRLPAMQLLVFVAHAHEPNDHFSSLLSLVFITAVICYREYIIVIREGVSGWVSERVA